MSAKRANVVACAIFAHAVVAYLGAEWVDMNIVVMLVAICTWPFWWAALGFCEMRTRVVYWSLAAGTIVYLPSLRVILLMVSSAGGGSR